MTTVPVSSKPVGTGAPAQSRLMVLMFTDAVGSVELKSRLGNESYSTLIGRHDELFKSIIADIPGASIYKDIGDGFLSGFERASDAVTAALRFQRALREEAWDPEPIRVRTGIHVGQIAQGVLEETGKPKLIGLAADVAARIMGLGLPGQILLSRSVFDDARQFIRRHPPGEPTGPSGATEPALRWVCHGLYRFKGADEPLEIYEVGADPGAPLKPPPSGDKASRVLSGEEELLGWRPAAGLAVPGRPGWMLERRLGEGAVGEAWLANNKSTRERRVFKFCFEAEKAAALRREAKLFRILRDALGSRPEIVRIHEVQLDSPPYFIESDYAELGSLEEWATAKNGFSDLALVDRVEFAARVADAAAAAHSIGVVHKDIKPANILVYRDASGPPHPRLADFGMAAIRDMSQLAARRVAVGGATLQELAQGTVTSDAPNYVPPEALAGRPHEEPGDVYALGVLTFQCVLGDFRRPLTPGWDRSVQDPMLRETIAAAIEHDERNRLQVAGDLASRLHAFVAAQRSGTAPAPASRPSAPPVADRSSRPAPAPVTPPPESNEPTNTLIESGPTPKDDEAVAATLREARPGPGPAPGRAGPARKEDSAAEAEVPTDWVFKAAPVAGVPERIGPYRVLKKIGAGGFGLVLEATREDSFQKRVAIKLLQRGAASEETLKRFERERQVMAAMNHPNIARLLEGGKTDDGRPWFAMEYVEGLPIDDYCDRNRLSVRERVAMFVKICSAMHTVHKAQVVHRDLKPANILVNTKGEPKLLDFGIAKMIEPEWGATPMVTRERRGPLTPQYASPEQVRGEPVTTSTDVYSLGVLLYELLTGRLPYRLAGMSDHELEAKVCHTMPMKPSVAAVGEPDASPTEPAATVTGGGSGAAQTAAPKRTWTRTRTVHSAACVQLADRRAATPEELRRQLGDDLDDIVMMALRKEPMRRYESAMEMGEDLKRHIDRMPVKARPETISYVARRFVGRHRGAVASALAMTVLIIAGLVIMTVLFFQAERARAKERESREQTLTLLGNFNGAFNSMRGAQAGELSDKAIVEAAAPIIEATKSIPASDVDLLERSARVLESIARTAGGVTIGSSSRFEAAKPSIDRAVELRRDVLKARTGDKDKYPSAAAALSQSASQAGDLYKALNATEVAQRFYAEAESAARLADSPECKRMLGMALGKRAGYAEGEERDRLIEESIRLKSDLAATGGKADYHSDLAHALFARADFRESKGDRASALRLHKTALENRLKAFDMASSMEARFDLLRSYTRLGRLYSTSEDPERPEKTDDFKAAGECYADAIGQAVALEKEAGAGNLPDRLRQAVMDAYTGAARFYTKVSKEREATESIERAWQVATAMKTKVRTDISTYLNLADAALNAGRIAPTENQRQSLVLKSKELYELVRANGVKLDEAAEQTYREILDYLDEGPSSAP